MVVLLQGMCRLLLVSLPLGDHVDHCWPGCCLVSRARGRSVVVLLVAVASASTFTSPGLLRGLVVSRLLVGRVDLVSG